ncbi:ATP-binding protein [Janthinobacterium sp. J1-1]|uniref:hybrid sensor histidine kinase/response regulator n=1 Tax=Janthinobacterium sp. J1-1 TaxID=3065910 RepID=UPI0028128CF9|nr:ATP-binding protein [Janthinobacterium sp. J1-1]
MEQRILIHAPAGQDAALAVKVLASATIDSLACHSVGDLAQQLRLGAGGVLTVEEALHAGAWQVLNDYAQQQPDWSDLPILLLTRSGQDSLPLRQAISTLGNLTLLERPVHALTLITSAHAMQRARARQYQVRESARRKDEFIATLGHELRNPLAPIRTSAALLNRLYPGSEQIGKVRDVIERQVTQLMRLVDDLLDVARITSGKVALQRQDVLLEQVIGHVVELCQEPASARQIALTVDLPPHPVLLHADHARLVQIFANIVSNAIKFTPPGGRIHIGAQMADEQLQVSVEDNGIGLDAEAIPRIFSMFEQSRTVSGQLASGLGIGLSLSRQFAEMHGGSVQAYSAGAGQGSRFVVTLPAKEMPVPPAEAVTAASAATAPAGAALQILVVDDNRDAADALQTMFQLDGHAAAVAYDGQQALVQVALAWPRLIVMDLGMPGMDGYETARQVRQLANGRDCLMIALTGWGQGEARQRTVEAGFDFHLTKPVDYTAIVALLERHLAGASPN